MYRKVDDFINDWQILTDGTKKIFDQLSNDILNQRIAEGHRNLGQLAWHIVVTIPEMMKLTGLPLSILDEKLPPPESAEEIRQAYKKVTNELSKAITTDWDDNALLQEDNLYGEKWKRGFTLTVLLNHEIHHRGQMTVLLRQADKTVPGIYGPSKEEWVNFGAKPPAY
jgi:uncharacterized damage-inducible protein DinB